MKRAGLLALLGLCLGSLLSAQVTDADKAPQPTEKPISPGLFTPTFWVGAQAVLESGYNMTSGASGMAYNGNDSWASFDVALVDSHYDVPKKFVTDEDPDYWMASVKLYGLTDRIDSYSSSPELNWPSWSVGIKGQGFTFGFFSQGYTDEDEALVLGGDTTNTPTSTIEGGNEVLYLGGLTAGSNDYLTATESVVSVSYPVATKALVGYKIPGYLEVNLTGGSRGTIAGSSSTNGLAGVLNFSLEPFGSSDDQPLVLGLTGDAIGGYNYTTAGVGNPVAFGLATQLDWTLGDDIVLSPIAAFDGRVNDSWTSGIVYPVGTSKFDWKTGGGFLLTLSPKRWVTDFWGELPAQSASEYFENSKILKFTYAQLMAEYGRSTVSQGNKDLSLVFKAEEPDGLAGRDENLGGMIEICASNLLAANSGYPLVWSGIGRLSYDLDNHKIEPYIRGYVDSTKVVKLRFGAQYNPMPGCALELTYMSANLTSGLATAQDTGRIELLVGLSTDSTFTRIPKTMSFSYSGTTPLAANAD